MTTGQDRLGAAALLALWAGTACSQQAPGAAGSPEAEHDSAPSGADTAGADTAGEDTADDTGAVGVRPGLPGLDDLGIHNVVVVHVDTLRRDHLAAYGYGRDTLPRVGQHNALVVEDYHATTSWTVPSTLSAMSGLAIETHGVAWHDTDSTNAPFTSDTLSSQLSALGFATLLANGNGALGAVIGADRGYDAVVNEDGEKNPALRAVGLAEATLDWLDGLAPGTPFFVWMQPMDTHGPYLPGAHLGTWSNPEAAPFDTSTGTTEDEQAQAFIEAVNEASGDEAATAEVVAELNAIYDETILNADDGVATLLDGLQSRGLDRATLVVLTSDHGETLGDEAPKLYFGHGGTTRPELVRVPLLFIHPDLVPSSTTCLSQNVDLAPTLARALGLSPGPDQDGRPLQESCRDIVHACLFLNNTDENRLRELSATNGDGYLRWVCAEGTEVGYDLGSDPSGTAPLDRADTPGGDALAADLSAFEERLRATVGPPPCFDP